MKASACHDAARPDVAILWIRRTHDHDLTVPGRWENFQGNSNERPRCRTATERKTERVRSGAPLDQTRLIDCGGSNDLPLAHDLTTAWPLANRDLALPGADGTLLEVQMNECARERSSPQRSERSAATARPVAGP
jgi:hypothetical protein